MGHAVNQRAGLDAKGWGAKPFEILYYYLIFP